jgi:hypothetical protein
VPVWHASASVGKPLAELNRYERRIVTRLAAQALAGVGSGDLIVEAGDIAIHVRKRTTPAEGAAIGGAEDVRGR